LGTSSDSALQACTEQPTFCRDTNSNPCAQHTHAGTHLTSTPCAYALLRFPPSFPCRNTPNLKTGACRALACLAMSTGNILRPSCSWVEHLHAGPCCSAGQLITTHTAGEQDKAINSLA
jgi:hypothetical protein